VTSGDLRIVLLSDHDAILHGKDTFLIEFRKASDGALVDVGDVRASATMPMPGMPMFASIDLERSAVAGRYTATGEFSMAGTWRMNLEWNGGGGRGSVSFSGSVQ
jgi:YtkA-like